MWRNFSSSRFSLRIIGLGLSPHDRSSFATTLCLFCPCPVFSSCMLRQCLRCLTCVQEILMSLNRSCFRNCATHSAHTLFNCELTLSISLYHRLDVTTPLLISLPCFPQMKRYECTSGLRAQSEFERRKSALAVVVTLTPSSGLWAFMVYGLTIYRLHSMKNTCSSVSVEFMTYSRCVLLYHMRTAALNCQ